MKQLVYFFIPFIYALFANAQISCETLFNQAYSDELQSKTYSSEDLKIKFSSLGVILSEARPPAEVFKMSDLVIIRSNFEKFNKKAIINQKLLNYFKSRTGSSVSRSRDEASAQALKIIIKLRTTGLIDRVASEISSVFKNYEVYFNLAQETSKQILNIDNLMRESNLSEKINLQLQKRKLNAKLNYYNSQIGLLHEPYIAIRKRLIVESQSDNAEFAQNAFLLIQKLENASSDLALAYPVTYKRFSIDTAERYVAAQMVSQNSYVKSKMQKELLYYPKMILLNTTAFESFKNYLYKIPSELSFFGLNVRDFITNLLGIGYNKSLKRTYLEPISELIEIQDIPDKYERLKALNQVSQRPNELLQILSRLVETEDTWVEIIDYAQSIRTTHPREEGFYQVLKTIDDAAAKQESLSLFNEEPRVTTSIRIITSAAMIYYFADKIGLPTDQLNQFIENVRHILP